MKKITYLCLSFFLCSCAGNPPAWWNPAGRYNAETTTTPQSSATVTPRAAAQPIRTPSPVLEETFTPEETSFEEMNLEPIADESLEGAVESLQPSVLED